MDLKLGPKSVVLTGLYQSSGGLVMKHRAECGGRHGRQQQQAAEVSIEASVGEASTAYTAATVGTPILTNPYTVFSFAIFACPLSAVCIVIFQEFVLGGLFTFLQNIVLGVLAFFAEILLARGLQLGKIAKVANILYIKVLLSQMWSMTFFGAAPTLNKLIGCLLVLASTCGTSYFGLEKENE